MIVDVVVVGWQQACCGEPFEVGGRVSWTVYPRDRADAPRRRFIESHHDGLDLDGEQMRLEGTVLEIVAVREGIRTIPATRALTNDPGNVTTRPVQRVGRFDVRVEQEVEGLDDDLLVAVELEDDVALPAFFLDDVEKRAADIADAARAEDEAWSRTVRGREVAELLTRIRAQYGEVVEIAVGTGGAGVTIVPCQEDASDCCGV